MLFRWEGSLIRFFNIAGEIGNLPVNSNLLDKLYLSF